MSPARNLSALSLALALSLGASAVGAQERCSGTLCDFYYGNSSPAEQPAAKPAAPTPLTVPSLFSGTTKTQAGAATPGGAAPAQTSRVHVEGGGLLSLMRGQPTERCSGTVCDLYYGGPAPEKPPAAPPVAVESSALPPEAVAADEPEEAPRRGRSYETVEREVKPRCVAPAQDPWRCYR